MTRLTGPLFRLPFVVGGGARTRTQLLAQAWRVIAVLFCVLGEHLRAHQEYSLVQLLRRLPDDARTTYEQREVMLQALILMTSAPYYVVDLYINYDCELHGSNLCDDLVRFLAVSAAGLSADVLLALSTPTSAAAADAATIPAAAPNPLQLLCLEPLLLALQHMADRCELTVRFLAARGPRAAVAQAARADAGAGLRPREEGKLRGSDCISAGL